MGNGVIIHPSAAYAYLRVQSIAWNGVIVEHNSPGFVCTIKSFWETMNWRFAPHFASLDFNFNCGKALLLWSKQRFLQHTGRYSTVPDKITYACGYLSDKILTALYNITSISAQLIQSSSSYSHFNSTTRPLDPYIHPNARNIQTPF